MNGEPLIRRVEMEGGESAMVAQVRCQPNEFAKGLLESALTELRRAQSARDAMGVSHLASVAMRIYSLSVFTSSVAMGRSPTNAHLLVLELHEQHQREALAWIQSELERFFKAAKEAGV